MIETEEIWLPIDDYDAYFVSNLGRIKSCKRQKHNPYGVIIPPRLTKSGYLIVNLYKNSKGETYRIHRLVMLIFTEFPGNTYEINHIDGVKTNNALSNLEWVTKSENEKHAYKIGLKTHLGEKHNLTALVNDDIYAIKELLYSGDLTQLEVGYLFGVSRDVISQIACNSNWSHLTYNPDTHYEDKHE